MSAKEIPDGLDGWKLYEYLKAAKDADQIVRIDGQDVLITEAEYNLETGGMSFEGIKATGAPVSPEKMRRAAKKMESEGESK